MTKEHTQYVPFDNTFEFLCAYTEMEEKLYPDTDEAKIASQGLKVKSKFTGKYYPVLTKGLYDLFVYNKQNEEISLIQLFDDYVFPDGSPCGKPKEE